MSKEQVARDYEKLLEERRQRIESETPKTLWQKLLSIGAIRYYPMPLMPIDNDFRKARP